MNQYGAIFQKHWETYRPRETAALRDPEAFFTELGEQAAEEIEQLTETLHAQHQEQQPPGNSFLANLGQRGNARMTAESTVLREMLPPSEDELEPINPEADATA